MRHYDITRPKANLQGFIIMQLLRRERDNSSCPVHMYSVQFDSYVVNAGGTKSISGERQPTRLVDRDETSFLI